MDLAARAAATESAGLPSGDQERFAGYGVMGLPFASGHVLAMRRFPASSIGPPYTSVWHRSPAGDWTFWQDEPSDVGCGRYFSAEVSVVESTEITVAWPSPNELLVTVPDVELTWRSRMESPIVFRAFNRLGSIMPDRAWRSAGLLRRLGPVAGRILGVGPIGLVGSVPNGQSFVANPMQIWCVTDATATLGQVDFGAPGPLGTTASLGDFVIPRRGVFALGRAFFG